MIKSFSTRERISELNNEQQFHEDGERHLVPTLVGMFIRSKHKPPVAIPWGNVTEITFDPDVSEPPDWMGPIEIAPTPGPKKERK